MTTSEHQYNGSGGLKEAIRFIKPRTTGWECSTNGRDEKCVKILVGKPKGKRQFGRPRRRWKDNITRDLRETG
jgi:hypothetical protein